jgi:hypothetical protein
MTQAVDDLLATIPAKQTYLLLGFGCFAVKFGPYPPEKLNAFIERLMDAHEGPHRFMFTLECGEVEDPVPLLLDLAMAAPDEGAEAGEGGEP